MTEFRTDRRSLLKGGATLLAAAATMSSEQLLGYAKAWAQSAPWKPEAGATINLLRWKRFVEAEDVAFMKIVDAFQKANNVTINVSNESYDAIQPKASVAANTGQGLDMVWGLYSLPFLFPSKCTDMTDVADYLAKKCGGWADSGKAYGMLDGKWIGIPVAAIAAMVLILAGYSGVCAVLVTVGGALIRHRTDNPYLHLALGCVLLLVVGAIPWIGDALVLIVALTGFGAVLSTRFAGLLPMGVSFSRAAS